MIIGPKAADAGAEIPMTPEQTAYAQTLDFESLKAYMNELTVRHHGLIRDIYNPEVAYMPDTPRTPQPKKFAKTLKVDGETKVFEGDSELDVERQATAYLAEAFTKTATQEQPRGTDGKFKAADPDAAAQQRFVDKVELELQFKRGDIDTATLLERSGAIEDALDRMGISEIIEQHQGQKQTKSWEEAVETFKQGDGADWPAGDNLQIIHNILTTSKMDDGRPLIEAEDKVGALAWAWQKMKAENLVVENPVITQHSKLAKASSRAEIDSILGRDTRHSQIWNS